MSFYQTFQFEKVVKNYGEDSSKMQPDEFFGIFDIFLSAFADARVENEKIRRQREEDEKRAKMEAQVSALRTGAGTPN